MPQHKIDSTFEFFNWPESYSALYIPTMGLPILGTLPRLRGYPYQSITYVRRNPVLRELFMNLAVPSSILVKCLFSIDADVYAVELADENCESELLLYVNKIF